MLELLQGKEFTLVLSGGGALGIAHLGVLHRMEEQRISPSEVVGTSMGGIVAACIAIGMSEVEIYQQIKAFSSVSKWIKFSFQGNAIIDTSKIEDIFSTIFGNKKMKDTELPLKLIATKLSDGQKRVFTTKDNILIKDAVLATMAIPGIFNAHSIDGVMYSDGFLCEHLGLHEASFYEVLAVDVLGKNSFEEAIPNHFFKTSNVLEMFEKSMRLLIYNQTKTYRAYTDKHIILFEPNTKGYNTFHFHKYEEIRALGLDIT